MDGLDPFNDWFGERKPPEPTTPAPEPTDSHGGAARPVRLDEQTAEPVTAEHDAVPADIPAMPAQPATILHAALAWAARGFRVFPLAAGGKVPPKDLAWKTEATTDPAKIRAWWTFEPRYNYGVAAGDGVLILDVDAGKNGYAALLDLDLPPTLTVKTPGGGEHQYFSGPDVANSVDRVGDGLDIRSDRGYVVGPGSFFADSDPGTKKGYTGSYQVINDVPPAVAPESLVLLAGTPKEREQGPAVSIDDPDDIVFAIHYLLKDAPIAIEGRGGDNTAYAVAARVIEIGVSAERAADLMAEHWNERCLPPWTREELLVKATNAQNYAQSRQGSGGVAAAAADWQGAVVLPPAPVTAFAPGMSLDAVLAQYGSRFGAPIRAGQEPPNIPWLVEDLIPESGAGVLFGPSTGGKSTLVLDLAAKLASGEPWFGSAVPRRRGTVIFVFEGKAGMHAKLHVLGTDTRVSISGIVPIPASRMKPEDLRAMTPILKAADFEMRQACGFGVGLVVFDTLSASGLAAKENDTDDASPAISAVAEFAASVGAFALLVHHPRRGSEEMRGSGSWYNNVETVLRVGREGKSATRTLTADKVRDGEERDLGAFTLEPLPVGSKRKKNGEPVTACIVRQVQPPGRPRSRVPAHFVKFLAAFRTALDEKGSDLTGGRRFVAISDAESEFRDLAKADLAALDSQGKAWRRCRDHAKAEGYIEAVPGSPSAFMLTAAAHAIENPHVPVSHRAGLAADFDDATTIQ